MNEWMIAVGLGLLAGGSVFALILGLAGPRARSVRAQRETTLAGIQVRLDRARLGVDAGTYLARSLVWGAGFGALMVLATGAWLTLPAGVVAGFAFVWSRLEDERNERLNRYHKALASAADTIVNSWRVRPSMNRALEAVATYGQPDVAALLKRATGGHRGAVARPAGGTAARNVQQATLLVELLLPGAEHKLIPAFATAQCLVFEHGSRSPPPAGARPRASAL